MFRFFCGLRSGIKSSPHSTAHRRDWWLLSKQRSEFNKEWAGREKTDFPWVCWESKLCHSYPGTGATSWAAKTWIKRFYFLWSSFSWKDGIQKSKAQTFGWKIHVDQAWWSPWRMGLRDTQKKMEEHSDQKLQMQQHYQYHWEDEFLSVVSLQFSWISTESVRSNSGYMQEEAKNFLDQMEMSQEGAAYLHIYLLHCEFLFCLFSF